MKENRIIKHFLVIGSGALISMFIGLLTAPIITRIVSPEIYGQLSIFNMYTNIFVMVFCLGLDQSLVRFYYSEKEDGYKAALLFRCVFLPVIGTLFIAAVFIILTSIGVISFEFTPNIVILLCINILCQLIYRFSVLVVRLEYKSKLFSILNIISKTIYVGFALPLILLTKIDYFHSLIIATVTATVTCLVLSIFWQKDVWSIKTQKRYKADVKFGKLISYGWPFIISMGITQLFQAIDKISLNHYCTYTEVGVYSSAMTLVNIFAIVQSTFNSLWAPIAIEHYEKDKNDKLFYQQGNQYITIIMFGLGISLILVKDVFALILGPSYREAAYILPFLIFNPIMYTISETTVQGIVFMKKNNLQIIVGAIACIVNFLGNTFLVPIYGSKGAAISTGISYIVFFTLRTVFSNRYFYVDFKLKKFYLMTVFVLIYAWYNTFFKFGIRSIIGYVILLLLLIGLYFKAFKEGFNYFLCHLRSARK